MEEKDVGGLSAPSRGTEPRWRIEYRKTTGKSSRGILRYSGESSPRSEDRTIRVVGYGTIQTSIEGAHGWARNLGDDEENGGGVEGL
jgi:hypothetical protein